MPISGMTDYQASRILGDEFGGNNYTPETAYYIGVSTTAINQDGTGANEPDTDVNYERILIDNNNTNWENISLGVGKQNAIPIEFNPASINQGNITYIGIWDSLTLGNILYYSELINVKNVGIDDILRIDVGNLQIRLLPTT